MMLCKICNDIFQASSMPQPKQWLDHHINFESFYDAVQQECYICSKVWRKVGEYLQTTGNSIQSWFEHTDYSIKHHENPRWFKLMIMAITGDFRDNQYECFTLMPLTGASPLTRAEDLVSSTASPSSWMIAAEWLKTCTQNHHRCNQQISGNRTLPARLIDTGTSGSCAELRVIHTSEEHPTGPYMTLSHCWGSGVFTKLTDATLQHLGTGFAISILPKTFQDAVHIVRWFGVRYLWIDSLCILQDSIRDWQHEASLMEDVYKNALCNIAAMAASSGDDGLFAERNVSLVCPCQVELNWYEAPEETWFLIEEFFWENAFTNAPLIHRGWVVQERLLAPRVLHFGRDQLFWECHEINACETFPKGVPTHLGRHTNFKGLDPLIDGERQSQLWRLHDPGLNGYLLWHNIVTTYRSCDLTKEDDKLLALSGIAKNMQRVLDDEYLAGLWRRMLPVGLLWVVDKCKQKNNQPSRRPQNYRAPSWSWASVDGFGHNNPCRGDILVNILEARVTPLAGDPTGQVADGYIILHGLIIEAELHGPDKSQEYSLKVKKHDFENDNLWIHPDVPPEGLYEELYCLPITSMVSIGDDWVYGVVLQKTGFAENEYKRFGSFTVMGKQLCQFFNPSSHEDPLHGSLDSVKKGFPEKEYKRFGSFKVTNKRVRQFFNPSSHKDPLHDSLDSVASFQTIKLV